MILQYKRVPAMCLGRDLLWGYNVRLKIGVDKNKGVFYITKHN